MQRGSQPIFRAFRPHLAILSGDTSADDPQHPNPATCDRHQESEGKDHRHTRISDHERWDRYGKNSVHHHERNSTFSHQCCHGRRLTCVHIAVRICSANGRGAIPSLSHCDQARGEVPQVSRNDSHSGQHLGLEIPQIRSLLCGPPTDSHCAIRVEHGETLIQGGRVAISSPLRRCTDPRVPSFASCT